jgi:signal transduction histidine kinase
MGSFPTHRLPVRASRLIAAFALGICAPGAHAGWPVRATVMSSAAIPARQYTLNIWPVSKGAPADIWAIIQKPDGALLLGTGGGLFTFDGVHFEKVAAEDPGQILSKNTTALAWLPNGDVLAAFFYDGAALIHAGKVVRYGAANGYPDAETRTFGVDADGVVWAATSRGLLRRDAQGSWRAASTDWNFKSSGADWLSVDPDGTLWVAADGTLVFLRRGSHAFEATHVKLGLHPVFARDGLGHMWLSDELHGTRVLPGLSAASPSIAAEAAIPKTDFGKANRLHFDRDGALWASAHLLGGAYRVDRAAQPVDGRPLERQDISEVYNKQSGLPSDVTAPVMSDREGNVWLGTNFGLAGMTANPFTVIQAFGVESAAASYSVSTGASEVLWASGDGRVFRALAGRLDDVGAAPPGHVYGLSAGRDHVLWAEADDRLYRLGPAGFTELPGDHIDPRHGPIVSDNANGLYIARPPRALLHFTGENWSDLYTTGMPDSEATVLAVDHTGALWAGYKDGTVVIVQGTGRRILNGKSGLGVGLVTAIAETDAGMLVAGDAGLARLDGRTVATIASSPGMDISGATGIAQSKDGAIWLNARRGVYRFAKGALDAAFEKPEQPVAFNLFDSEYGLPGIARQSVLTPSASMDAEGTLWFSTNQGLVFIDPAHLRLNTVRPGSVVTSVTANGQAYRASPALSLPKLTTSIFISYTAASLTMPGRVQFRTRLDGVDTAWQNAGARREAFYTNLEPGKYTFHVTAANNDGLRGDEAVLTFRIEAAYYQTRWFALLCGVLALTVLLALVLVWSRQVTLRDRARIEARHEERNRVARELHDTLLQAVYGLVLRFQSVVDRIADEETRDVLELALQNADDVLVEGRMKIGELRDEDVAGQNLHDALAAVGNHLEQDSATVIRLSTTGVRRALSYDAFAECLAIGREAIANAYQHARASVVEVEIRYTTHALELVVRDDGRGIDDRVLCGKSATGHWGIAGMKERAAALGARLDILDRNPYGTEIRLKVPAAKAWLSKKNPP